MSCSLDSLNWSVGSLCHTANLEGDLGYTRAIHEVGQESQRDDKIMSLISGVRGEGLQRAMRSVGNAIFGS